MTGLPNDGEGVSLDATLLIITENSSSVGKYRRIWRRYLFVRFFLSIRKTLHQSAQLSSSSAQDQCLIGIDSDADEQLYSPDDILKIVKERDIVSLNELGGVEKAASILCSNSLSASRLLPHKHLTLQAKTLLCIFLKACKSLTILLLMICAGLSFAVELIEQGTHYGWHDGVAILVTVLLLVTFRCVSEFQIKKKNKQKAEVMRNGDRLLLPIIHLVMGDVVYLNEGDVVPVNGLFVYGGPLVLDDNSITDRVENPFLLRGSEVIEGCGQMIVVSDLEGSNVDPEEMTTLLAARIHKPNSYIDNLGLAVSVLIAFVVLIGLICRRNHKNDDISPELKGNLTVDRLFKIFESTFLWPRGRVHILTGTLAAFLIGMQHGMPFAITVSLSFWNRKVELCGAKPQNLSACGTMGLVTVICVNATGGLMFDQMEVKEFFVGRENMYNTVDPKFDKFFIEALCRGICVPETSISPTNDVAVSAWVKSKLGCDMELLNRCFSVVDHGRLRTDAQCSRAVIMENEKGGILHMHLKGDASTILNLCSHYYDKTGEIHSMEDEGLHFQQVIANMKSRGLKTVAFRDGDKGGAAGAAAPPSPVTSPYISPGSSG